MNKTETNEAPDDFLKQCMDDRSGWWVPVAQFWRQTLLPHTGSWQWVRTLDGKTHKATVLPGSDNWRDTNFAQVPGVVTDWFKPVKWFRGRADCEGRRDQLEAARRNLTPRVSNA